MTKKRFSNVVTVLLFLIGFMALTLQYAVAAPAELPATGQTSCYAADTGSNISCSGTGQDGDLQKGVAWPNIRFTYPDDGTFVDNLTGLIWPQNANTPGPANCMPGTAQTWGQAQDYVDCINSIGSGYLGFRDWRLPNVNELKSLINAGQMNPGQWLVGQGFTGVRFMTGDSYWTSSMTLYKNYRWFVDMTDGTVDFNTDSALRYAWPVRGGACGSGAVCLPKTGQTDVYMGGDDGALQMGVAWPEPRFSDNGDETVTDNLTGLIWKKDFTATGPQICGNGTFMSWQDALTYVACLNSGTGYLGFKDWRVPNRNELRSLIKSNLADSSAWLNTEGFAHLQQGLYWSSTSYENGTRSAWVVNLGNGSMYPNGKANSCNLLPVRGGGGGAAVPPATGTTLAPGVASPQLVGNSNITFTAIGAGGSGSYEYKFWLKANGLWNMVRDFSGTNTWTLNTNGMSAGIYDVLVYVRSSGSTAAYDALNSVTYVLVANPPATGVTLVPGIASPQVIGNNNITFTAGGAGGSGTYEYKFWLKTGGVWNVTQDYSAPNAWTWNTNGAAAGSYEVLVYVRNIGSGAAHESLTSLTYALVANPPATGATLTPSIASPQVIGSNSITFTASGIGGSGTYEYKFLLKSGGVWNQVQAYSTTTTWSWDTTGLPAGTYGVQVNVRNVGSIAKSEAAKSISYILNAFGPATGATLTPSPASPQNAGTSVTFTAGGIGGSGNYEYKFWIKTGGVWAVVQDYSTTNTFDWNTTGLTPGTYRAQVNVRNVGSSAKSEAVLGMGYVIK